MLEQNSNQKIPVILVAALGKNTRVIGKNNELLWHIPEDLKRFKALTLGKPILLGRKTFESILTILGKPLPGRTNIIITRDPNYTYGGVKTATSLEEAFAIARAEEPNGICIGGGGEIYRQALPYTDRLYLTWVDDDDSGDAFFPELTNDFVVETEHEKKVYEDISYQWIDYIRSNTND